MADVRGDLIIDGFEPLPSAPHVLDEHDLALPSDNVQEIAPTTAPTLNSEPIAPSEDGGIDPAMEAALSAAIEPMIDLTRAVLLNCRILLRPRTPNRLRLFLSNPIGCRSWSLPPQIFFSTRPSATY